MGACTTAAAFAAFLVLLLAASLQDIRERRVSNRIILSMCALWAVWRIALAALSPETMHESAALLVGALATLASIFAFTAFAERTARRFLFGGGDIKLLAATSLFLGVGTALAATFIACIVSLAYAALRSERGIPFAPGVLCGTALALLL